MHNNLKLLLYLSIYLFIYLIPYLNLITRNYKITKT